MSTSAHSDQTDDFALAQNLIDTFQYTALSTLYGDTPGLEELIETNPSASFFLILLVTTAIRRRMGPGPLDYLEVLDHIADVTRQELEQIPAETRRQDLHFFLRYGPHPPNFQGIRNIASDWFPSDL